ncbi:MAG: ZIP family metal transporter [Candidatus Diapherotrites archaeon]|nr:ZIP family metal transporter [Candidatus Diapherotrites archaeon]
MLEIITLATLSGLTTFIGVWLATVIKKNKTLISIGIGFSSGVMIAISFLELMPMAMALAPGMLVLAAFSAGFGIVWLFDYFLPHMHFIKEAGKMGAAMKTGYLVTFGIIIHDFPEGFAMATAFVVNPLAGILVAIAIAIHNIPEEFALGVPLVLMGKKKLLYKLALVSALAEPAGAAIGLFLFSAWPALNPLMLAFAAGAMVFVSIDELLPLAQKYGGFSHASLGLLFGIVTYAVLALALGV